MKRKLAIGWLALCGATFAFLLVGFIFWHGQDPFWQWAKAISSTVALSAPAVRYLRNHPKGEISERPARQLPRR